jgi:hypothetical protein
MKLNIDKMNMILKHGTFTSIKHFFNLLKFGDILEIRKAILLEYLMEKKQQQQQQKKKNKIKKSLKFSQLLNRCKMTY